MVDPNETVGEFVTRYPEAIPRFEEWKVDYCCGGAQKLEDVCRTLGITVQELEQRIAAAPRDVRVVNWNERTVSQLLDHILDYFHVQTREQLDRLEMLAAKVLAAHGTNHVELEDVATLVKQLANDLRPHMLKEEQVLFPYIRLIEAEANGGASAPEPFFGTVRNPVRMMMMEHDAAAEILGTLNEVTDGYKVPQDGCNSYREFYRSLDAFEKLTHEHMHLENNLLFPKALELETREGAEHHCCGGGSCV